MKILIACEFSGIVRDAFSRKGHDAWSCDVLPTERPSLFHIQGDVLEIINDGWDMMIAHPPCTYLCCGSMAEMGKHPERRYKMYEALDFVMALSKAPIEKICIENPIGRLSTLWRKPDQITYPYNFGHQYRKDICFWLKNLPPLEPTEIKPPPYKKLDFWSKKRYTKYGGSKKSITFSGIANAMADQWG